MTKPRPARRLALALVPVLAAGCGAPVGETAGSVGPAPGVDGLAGRITEFVAAEMEDKGIPAMAIALTDGDRIVWARGFGEARPGVAADADTLFRVGSVSKLFTDVAVVARHEQGSLDLDAEVSEALPGFAPGPPGSPATGVTLRRLMAHRAGLVREPPVGHYFDDSSPSLEATVESLNGAPLVFPPGASQKYSNAGIAVVGRVLEHVAGRPFEEAVTAEVLRPLGLESSWFSVEAAPPERLASGLMWSYDGREFPAPGFALGMSPAGSMVTSVRDLGVFLTRLAGGRLPGVLESGALEAMWRVQFPPEGEADPTTGFGLGFHRSVLEAAAADGTTTRHPVVGHGGAIYGFSTELAFLPETGLGAVAVSSVDFTGGVVARIVRLALLELLARDEGPPPDYPRTWPLPSGVADRLHGRWEATDGTRIRLLARADPDRAPGEDRLELVGPTANLQLRAAEPGTDGGPLRLVADSRLATSPRVTVRGSGDETALTLEPGGLVFRRIPDPRPPPPPPGLLPLLGEYGWDHNILFVFESDGVLAVLIEWLERQILTPDPEDPDRFLFPDRGLYPGESLRFLRGDEGAVTGVSLSGIVFPRRSGPGEGTFRIVPRRPVDELRRIAGEASPPVEEGDFLPSDLARITDLDPTIRLDVRYAGTDNFMGAAFYDVADAFLQRPAAEALVRAHRELAALGLGITVHDGYRPWRVTRMFWDATPERQRLFVADPASGSRHNRGAAVDLGVHDLATGAPQRFVSGYDEFSERAFPGYVGGTSEQRWLREQVRRIMEREGFVVYEHEWWHFDYRGWERYRLGNQPLRAIGAEARR